MPGCTSRTSSQASPQERRSPRPLPAWGLSSTTVLTRDVPECHPGQHESSLAPDGCEELCALQCGKSQSSASDPNSTGLKRQRLWAVPSEEPRRGRQRHVGTAPCPGLPCLRGRLTQHSLAYLPVTVCSSCPLPFSGPPTLWPGDPSILHGLRSQQQIQVELEGPRAHGRLSPARPGS